MTENPYESPRAAVPPLRTRGLTWAILLGIGFLAMAAICVLLTIVGMAAAFQNIAASAAPRPADLAQGISLALLPLYAAAPCGLLGIVLIVVGLVVRRPVES